MDGSNYDLTSGSNSGRDYEAEMAEMREEYEKQIAQLRSQYGEEHANRSKLEEEMLALKQSFEAQMAKTAKVIIYTCTCTCSYYDISIAMYVQGILFACLCFVYQYLFA